MNKLQTREQAEARAMELFPKVPIHSQHYVTNQIGRQTFLQCWDEMQRHQNEERLKDVPKKYRDMPIEVVNKQTCGLRVEPKGNQPISEQSEKKVNKSVQKELLSEMMRKDEASGMYDDINEIELLKKELKLLREAAEKVVYEWHNSVGEECIDAAMVKLVKVLNSKKH